MINNLQKFLNEEQDPKAVEKVIEKVSALLMSNEEIQYIAVQKKPAINLSPDALVLTNKRVIFCRPKNLGLSLEFQDYIWKDIADCHMKEGILGAEFTVATVKGTFNVIDYLPKVQARKLYTIAQEQEEIQRENRRQLDLEYKRAAAGQITVNAAAPEAPVPTTKQDDPMASLQKLKTLLDSGLITQQDFDTKKAEILARL